MRIDVLTLFGEMFAGVLSQSILKRAQEKGLLKVVLRNIRDFATDKHASVDDRPYGGGAGMVLMAQPVFDAVEAVQKLDKPADEIVLLSPQGARFNQEMARELAKSQRVILIAGHYEGFDERIRTNLATREISIGDYVLSGGELPAMVLIDAIARLIPGVLGSEGSTIEESFGQDENENMLEYPQYTRPAEFRGLKVPDILLSGNHQAIKDWRRRQAEIRTRQRRPDL